VKHMASPQEIRAVRLRYPDAAVGGSGCWGAITECSGRVGVCLFLAESVAKAAVAGSCRANMCVRLGHRVERFQVEKPMIRFGQMDADDRRYEREQRRMEAERK
jgi:hypothetical protein